MYKVKEMIQFIIIILTLLTGMVLYTPYSIQKRAAKDVIALEGEGLKIAKCSLKSCLLEGNGKSAEVEAHWTSAFFPPKPRQVIYYSEKNLTKYYIIYKPKKLMLKIPSEMIEEYEGNLPSYEELLKNEKIQTTPMTMYWWEDVFLSVMWVICA